MGFGTPTHCQEVSRARLSPPNSPAFFYSASFLALSHALLHPFSFTGGQVFSWGQNQCGQLGLGMSGQSISTPHMIQSLQGIPFAQISAGGAHSFALTLSGAVFGWGRNKFGQLGLNDTNGGSWPKR